MTLVEYTLPDYSELRAYYGAATKTIYWFGKSRAQGYVDTQDLDGFLSLMGGRAFRTVEAEKVVA